MMGLIIPKEHYDRVEDLRYVHATIRDDNGAAMSIKKDPHMDRMDALQLSYQASRRNTKYYSNIGYHWEILRRLSIPYYLAMATLLGGRMDRYQVTPHAAIVSTGYALLKISPEPESFRIAIPKHNDRCRCMWLWPLLQSVDTSDELNPDRYEHIVALAQQAYDDLKAEGAPF